MSAHAFLAFLGHWSYFEGWKKQRWKGLNKMADDNISPTKQHKNEYMATFCNMYQNSRN